MGSWEMIVEKLSLVSASHQDLVIWLVLALGLIQCFFGYRLFLIYIFLAGALVGLFLSSLAVSYFSLEPIAATAVIIGVSIICGFLLLLIHDVGVFVIGLLLGSSFVLLFYNQSSSSIPALVVGLLVGILFLWLKRPVIIFVSAVTGAIIILESIISLFFAETHTKQLLEEVQTLLQTKQVTDFYFFNIDYWQHTDSQMLTLFATSALIAVLGMFFQWKTTKGNAS